MFEHEIRWPALVPASILLGLTLLTAEAADLWFQARIRPDWFWCLAFFATRRTHPAASMFAVAWCGFARDFLLGARPGSATLAFLIVGWLTYYWRPAALDRGWPVQLAVVGATAFAVSVLGHGFVAGVFFRNLWDGILVDSVGNAVLTMAVYFPVSAVLAVSPFRPWRERSGYY